MSASIGAAGSVAWIGGTHAQLAGTGTSPMEWTLNLNGDDMESTAFGTAGPESHIKGLQSWEGEFTAYLKTPDHGAAGLVTFAAGTVLNMNAWDMNISRSDIEVTSFNATNPTVKAFIPGLFNATGSFSGFLDNATSTTVPAFPANSSEPATGTFKYQEDGATDRNLSASIFTTQASWGARLNAANPISYTFRVSGDITQSTSSGTPNASILLSGAALDATAASAITLKSDATRTFTGSAFWKSIAISVKLGSITTVKVGFRGTGALSISA